MADDTLMDRAARPELECSATGHDPWVVSAVLYGLLTRASETSCPVKAFFCSDLLCVVLKLLVQVAKWTKHEYALLASLMPLKSEI